jgi:aryl-alcohol dehydrogenase-like predicted oxidoreductase
VTQRVDLAPGYTISRIVKGGWQLAGGHGAVDPAAALADMHAYVEAGITTFDCADIYTGVEALIGEFVRQRGGAADLQIHTKYVPDRSRLGRLTARDVAAAVERSLTRLGVERLDLVQFHWWDYAVPGALEALGWLDDQRRAGRIHHLGVTNFDTPTLQSFLDAGLPVVAHQVQYSVLDRRPAASMAALCAARGVQLLCYGTVAGGFLADRYRGVPAPTDALENRSLVKYRLIVDEAGGWPALQRTLDAVAGVAARHGCGVAEVATAWTLHQPQVAATIVGARHGRHLAAAARAAAIRLDDADLREIDATLAANCAVPGDVYGLERVAGGRHAAVMKYELNTGAGA